MKPFYEHGGIQIFHGDCREILAELPDESVHCCVTSPPYWGLRDYGVEGQIGLEKTPELYVAEMVAIFREVQRVLRKDGTLWLNLGDSYAGSGRGSGGTYELSAKQNSNRGSNYQKDSGEKVITETPQCKPKDLCGIPWLVAFALRADGWCLRQEIIWSKPNPMPESVTDRCTKSHESLFLFAKAKWSGAEPRQFQAISDQDARWLALFLDTEGNICAKKAVASNGTDHFGAQICFASSSMSLLQEAQHIIGAGTVLQRGGTNAPMFYLQMSNRQAADLLHRLYPYLIVKQRQARLALHLQSVIATSRTERLTVEGKKGGRMRSAPYTAELLKIWATMKLLNHFGNPEMSWVPEPQLGRWGSCESYYYDAAAIKEPGLNPEDDFRRISQANGNHKSAPDEKKNGLRKRGHERPHDGFNGTWDALTKEQQQAFGANKRSVWAVATSPFPEAHFATFPPELIKPCILAGCPAGGTVLDPFMGAGTTALVAQQNHCKSLGIELNQEYIEIAAKRLSQEVLDFGSASEEKFLGRDPSPSTSESKS